MDYDISCPHCQRLDLVQSIPALCAEGTTTTTGSGHYTGVAIASTGFVPVVGTTVVDRTHTTALARSFASEPVLRPYGRLSRIGVLLLAPAILLFAVLASAVVFSEHMERNWAEVLAIAWFVGGASIPGGAVILTARGIRRRNAMIVAGRPAARHVWGAGWYCHRCGTAHWPQSPLPGLPARTPLTPDQFRWHVWNAGAFHGI